MVSLKVEDWSGRETKLSFTLDICGEEHVAFFRVAIKNKKGEVEKNITGRISYTDMNVLADFFKSFTRSQLIRK